MDDSKKKAHKRDSQQTEVTIIGMDMEDTPVQQAKPLPARSKPKMTFDSFWVLAQRKHGFNE